MIINLLQTKTERILQWREWRLTWYHPANLRCGQGAIFGMLDQLIEQNVDGEETIIQDGPSTKYYRGSELYKQHLIISQGCGFTGYYRNTNLHRCDGPAAEWRNGPDTIQEWWIDGTRYHSKMKWYEALMRLHDKQVISTKTMTTALGLEYDETIHSNKYSTSSKRRQPCSDKGVV